jgi:hypothetical protein
MAPEEFELTIPASEWPQNHALDSAATAIGNDGVSRHEVWTHSLLVISNLLPDESLNSHKQNSRAFISARKITDQRRQEGDVPHSVPRRYEAITTTLLIQFSWVKRSHKINSSSNWNHGNWCSLKDFQTNFQFNKSKMLLVSLRGRKVKEREKLLLSKRRKF